MSSAVRVFQIFFCFFGADSLHDISREEERLNVPRLQKGYGCIMIKIGFCDGDLSVLNKINYLLNQYRSMKNQEITAVSFRSSWELLSEIEKGTRFDALFLDVILPEGNGIHTAKEIRQYDSVVKIIFLTSSSEFAVQSYTVGAYSYQIKPIWEESFYQLMDSIVSECKKTQKGSLILRCKNGITRICLDGLEYCEVIGRTLFFHMKNKDVLESTGSLEGLCVQLEPYENFLRPHRSFLVNMEYIHSISYKAIQMDSLAEIPIPHGKCSEIKNRYFDFIRDAS